MSSSLPPDIINDIQTANGDISQFSWTIISEPDSSTTLQNYQAMKQDMEALQLAAQKDQLPQNILDNINQAVDELGSMYQNGKFTSNTLSDLTSMNVLLGQQVTSVPSSVQSSAEGLQNDITQLQQELASGDSQGAYNTMAEIRQTVSSSFSGTLYGDIQMAIYSGDAQLSALLPLLSQAQALAYNCMDDIHHQLTPQASELIPHLVDIAKFLSSLPASG